jgi:2-oxoisovalerate dehydrogenase E1 component
LYRATQAADILKEKYGLDAEIINLHSLVPLDYTNIIESVKKTGRVVLASDACARGSFLNDVARNITDLCFDYLDAPPAVVGRKTGLRRRLSRWFFFRRRHGYPMLTRKILPLPATSHQ